MLTLAVTSSTALVGVALADLTNEGGAANVADVGRAEILASHEVLTDRRHAEELTPMIAEVLADAGVSLDDVERFAVDVGPGRFTGMRVGITTVRTLAVATGGLVVPVTSLEALAAAHPGRNVTAVIDARRAEVFQQRFGPDGPLSEATVGGAEELAALVDDGDVVVGDGADRYLDFYNGPGRELIADRAPSAELIASIAASRTAVPGHEIEPLYLRAPDVQVNIKTRHNT